MKTSVSYNQWWKWQTTTNFAIEKTTSDTLDVMNQYAPHHPAQTVVADVLSIQEEWNGKERTIQFCFVAN